MELEGMYIVVFSIFAALILILLVVAIAVAFKIIETLKKVDQVVDDINGKAKKLDGVFDIVDSTSSFISGISNRFTDNLVAIITNFLDKKKKKEEE